MTHSRNRGRRVLLLFICTTLVACASGGAGGVTTAAAQSSRPDTTGLLPAGFGSLHQEDIALSVTANGLTVQAIPLGDDFIRTLSPDSYSSLLRNRESRRAALDTIARRTGQTSMSLWYVSFRNVQSGEAPFSPRDVIINNQGRDYKPLDVIGITPGFGEQRVRQREVHVGILVFEGSLNVNQPLTITIGTQTSTTNWGGVIQRVEAERARVRARAGARGQGSAEPPSW